jgi:hypothetical protein
VPWVGVALACHTQSLKAYKMTFPTSLLSSKSVGALKSFGPSYFQTLISLKYPKEIKGIKIVKTI